IEILFNLLNLNSGAHKNTLLCVFWVLAEENAHLQKSLKEVLTSGKRVLLETSRKEGVILPLVWKWIREAAGTVEIKFFLNLLYSIKNIKDFWIVDLELNYFSVTNCSELIFSSSNPFTCTSLFFSLSEVTSYFLSTVDVTLDLNTAHGNLIVSQDRKEVRYTETPQNRPKKPESFDNWYSVLGKESFSSGRFYYEVQVSQKACYVVGVVKQSINRKESITPNTAKGFWTVTFKDKTYTAAGDPPISINVRENPQKVGVYVDYEEGQVSFYNVETRSHIYTFTGYSFTEKMYPALNPCSGTPSVPLIITPVSV
uniref:B30.2/SPRY domain-containing protein n=1 Tax=Scleropages formosus TaxID=113540 RepID=A0A8D0CFW5_SCLFO